MRVLVVEDEERLAATIARGLRREGMAVDVAHDGASALEKASLTDYAVILLDRNLPLVHGDEVCHQLRRDGSAARVLMLTASASTADLVEGLSLGADDYLGKPFAFEELVARVRALGRRPPAVSSVLSRAGVTLDTGRREATREGQDLTLTPKEFAVLEQLMLAEGAAVSAEELLERVWDEQTDPFTNVVRVTLMTLRRKLGDPPIIDTVIGAGYRFG